jgi:glycosyltransferase involved in cell wall biosynthesis
MQCQQPMVREYHSRVFKLSLRQPFRLLWWTITFQLASRLQLRREYQQVAQSGLFDPVFYLEQNPALAEAGIDPLKHYLAHGLECDPHPLFHTDWYVRQNPDLVAAGASPLIHYLRKGWKEGRSPHPLFDAVFYLKQNPDVALAGTDPLQHYVARGGLEGRSPHPLFDGAWYLHENPHLAAAGINPLIHYLRQGWKQRCNPHALFDTAFYLEKNPDVEQAGVCPLQHYVTRGGLEGRSPHPLFDSAWYLWNSPDLTARKTNPLVHYLDQGWKERRNPHPLFESLFYLEQIPSAARGETEPLQHYLTRGGLEGLSPHPLFDDAWYLRQNPALVEHRINPLVHYLRHGWKDGQSPHRLFDAAFYLKQDPQTAAAAINPLMHYLAVGASKGLNPNPLFDSSYYRTLYLSAQTQGINPLIDYVLRGAARFNRPHPVFEPAFYVAKHPAARACGIDPLSHYLTVGALQRYSPHPLFDVDFYIEQAPALGANCSDLLQHYLYEGAKAGLDPCELFDSSFYLEQNPEVAHAGLNPLSHYLMDGAGEGCNPNPLFNTAFYLKQNPAVISSGMNPLVHFITYGAEEGRFPNPFFDPLYYLRNNPDVKRAGTNPLAHFLVRGGAQEGREPSRFFSTTRYMSEHPELVGSGTNPLSHFLGYQRSSGEIPAGENDLPRTPIKVRIDCAPESENLEYVATDLKNRLAQQGVDLLWNRNFRIAPSSSAITLANEAFRRASENNHHLLVLLAPALPEEKVISVLAEAFSIDPHFGAAVPRQSDPASGEILKVCNELGDPELRSLPRSILDWVPEYYILPEMLAACLLLRNSVLSNSELLDETYETLPGALLHYLCRARRRGFRCIVYNRAILPWEGGKCADKILVSKADVLKLHTEYPDAGTAQAEYRNHPLHIHESLLALRLSSRQADQRSLLLDIRGVPSHINGTTEAVLSLCDGYSAVSHDWEISLLAAPGTAEVHHLAERYPKWKIITKEGEHYFTAALRPSQPWDIASMIDLHCMALFNFYTMLDTIAWDILIGAPTELSAAWNFLSEHADGILYISEYTRDRFRTRFPLSRITPGYVSHLSFDPADYITKAVEEGSPAYDEFLLVVGNSFDHKNVGATVDVLTSTFPFRAIKALGLRNHPSPMVETFESGRIPQVDVDRLFAQASVIVFPSFYEGFGFPILKGLSYGRTVIARESGLLTEVASHYRGQGRLIAFRTATELVAAVECVLHDSEIADVPLGASLDASSRPINWKDVAAGVLGFVEERVQNVAASRWPARQRAIEQMTAYAI